MSRKYYCELCDKRFADNPQNRKNHMKGLQHQRMKKAHYDTFRDPAVVLAEEMAKKPCRTFQQSGECRFSLNCRFSHLTQEAKQDLENLVIQNKQKAASKHKSYNPNLDQWLAKRARKTAVVEEDQPNASQDTPNEMPIKEYTLPPSLMGIPNLPVSLLPAPPGSLNNIPVEEWG